MIDLVKKYFWVLNLVVIGICAFFGARASLHLFEGAFLVAETRPAPAPRTRPAPVSPKLTHGKETQAILERNMFCSGCPPIVAQPVDDEDDKAGKEIRTTLPLQLVATMVSTDPEWSFAVIKDTQGREVENEKGEKVQVFPFGIYSRGRRIDGHDATVDSVEERRVYLKVRDHIEYADLMGVEGAEKPTPVATRPPPIRHGGPLAADLAQGVRKVSDTQYEIDRNLLEKVLSDTNSIARSARVVPSVSPKDGKPNGFKLYAIRPGSVYSTIGLQNGDTVSAINGQDINSPEKAFELYAKLRTASHLQISVLRRGQPMTLDYSIR